MKLEDIEIIKENNFNFIHYNENVLIIFTNENNEEFFYVDHDNVNDEILNYLFDNFKSKIIVNLREKNVIFLDKKDFLNLIMWVEPNKYLTYKNMVFLFFINNYISKMKDCRDTILQKLTIFK